MTGDPRCVPRYRFNNRLQSQTSMPQQTYQGQLYDLRTDVLVMGEDVGEQLDRAISSIETLKYFV
ncbi:hypothetical protein ACKC5O_20510, partial [Aeromonas schubertii]|uniref:hypothetical protein n=1 Tax=Aeromonas schubertii TaxID=652 RepID=UPI0038B479D0